VVTSDNSWVIEVQRAPAVLVDAITWLEEAGDSEVLTNGEEVGAGAHGSTSDSSFTQGRQHAMSTKTGCSKVVAGVDSVSQCGEQRAECGGSKVRASGVQE
jgi:hypothetical protein